MRRAPKTRQTGQHRERIYIPLIPIHDRIAKSRRGKYLFFNALEASAEASRSVRRGGALGLADDLLRGGQGGSDQCRDLFARLRRDLEAHGLRLLQESRIA